MRHLSAIVSVLSGVVGHRMHYFTVRGRVAPQLVRNQLATVCFLAPSVACERTVWPHGHFDVSERGYRLHVADDFAREPVAAVVNRIRFHPRSLADTGSS
jgi:hypothetical protein